MNNDKFDIVKFYNDLSESWDKTRPAYGMEIFKKMTSGMDKDKRYSVLDFGCGTGLLCKYIFDNFSHAKVEGIDISNRMIEKAKSNCPGCSFYSGDISSIDSGDYDMIISKDVFNHIEDISKTVLKLDSLLRSSGKFVFANRERNPQIKKEITDSLESLGYGIISEDYSFKPTKGEIDSFIKTLSGFQEKHKGIIKDKLSSDVNYYIVFADKK